MTEHGMPYESLMGGYLPASYGFGYALDHVTVLAPYESAGEFP